MISRGPGFLVIRPLNYPLPPLPWASCLSFSAFLCVSGRAYWREGGGEGGGQGAESYDSKKGWSSINHSILSGLLSSAPFHPPHHFPSSTCCMFYMFVLRRLMDGIVIPLLNCREIFSHIPKKAEKNLTWKNFKPKLKFSRKKIFVSRETFSGFPRFLIYVAKNVSTFGRKLKFFVQIFFFEICVYLLLAWTWTVYIQKMLSFVVNKVNCLQTSFGQ